MLRINRGRCALLGIMLLGAGGLNVHAAAPATVDIIIDNQDTEGVQVNGKWVRHGGADFGFSGNGGWWLDDNNARADHSVVFTPNLPEAGDYQVYSQWIANPNHASNAKFTIAHAGGASEVRVNQRKNSGVWYELGTYHFDAGSGGSVTISDDGADGFVIAEAVRFVKEQVVVDYGSGAGPARHRASGILSSMSATKPGPDLVEPLHPQMFRVSMSEWAPDSSAVTDYPLMHSLGKYVQCVLSDTWAYPNPDYGWPGGPKDPDFSHWKQHVTDVMQKAKERGAQLQYDIWNEPDWYMFWPQNRPADLTQYRMMWLNAYRTIRSSEPGAEIVGPSSGWREKWIEDFLLWARDNECLPDVISWHEFKRTVEQSAHVTEHVETLKKWMAANNIKIERISINEYIGNDLETNPGAAVWLVEDLERAQVESAAHACWNEPDGSSQFHNFSLDGLLTPDLKPRSTWWTFKYYGDISGYQVKVSTGAGSIRGVAGYDTAKKEFHLLFGRGLGVGAPGVAPDLSVTLENMTAPGIFAEGESVKVQARRVTDREWDAVPNEPPLTIDTTAVIQQGRITVTLPKFGPSDSYAVAITKVPVSSTSISGPRRILDLGASTPARFHLIDEMTEGLVAQTNGTRPQASSVTLPTPAQTAEIYTDWPFNAAEAVRRQTETAAKLGLPLETEIPLSADEAVKLVLIPAGTFVMGSPPSEPLRGGGELQHSVRITKPFYIGKYLFTQGEWMALMSDNPSLFKDKPDSAKRPVEHVPCTTAQNHHGVDELLTKLQQVTPKGWKVRLPTEAEWEYACRAGTSTAYFCGDTITEAQANYDGTATKEGGTETTRVFQTTAVGSYPPNAWGLYDMAGNTLEWCQDWYDPNYYKNSPTDDPCNTTPAAWGVQRGGCWIHGPKLCRSAARSPSPQNYFAGSISFRVVLAPE